MAEQQGFTRPPSDPAADPGRVGSFDSSVSRADPIGAGHEAQDALDQTEGAYTDPPKVEGVSRGDASMQQFPSLAGYPGVEVLERSADVGGSRATKKHRKVFVVFTDGLDLDVAEFDHVPNFTATRQYMLEHGLRPVGDVTFAGTEVVDARNTAFAYEVEALPAAVAVDPSTAHTIVSQD